MEIHQKCSTKWNCLKMKYHQMELFTVTQGNDTVGNCDETNRNSWSQKIEMTSRETLTARIEKWNGKKISQSEMEIKLQKLKWIDQKLSQAETERKWNCIPWNEMHGWTLTVRNWKWIPQKTLTLREWNEHNLKNEKMKVKKHVGKLVYIHIIGYKNKILYIYILYIIYIILYIIYISYYK